MAPTTRTQCRANEIKKTLEAAKYAKRALKNCRKALLLDICEGMIEAYKQNGNRLPYGHVENLLKALKTKEPWMTRNIINKVFMKYRKDLNKKEADTSGTNGTKSSSVLVPDNITLDCTSGSGTAESDLTEEDTLLAKRNVGGRPQGSTLVMKMRKDKKIIDAKNECAKQFAALKEQSKKKTGKRMSRGTIQKIIDQVKKKRNLSDAHISPSVIRKIFYRGSLENHHLAREQETPLRFIEPIIVDIILQMTMIGQCLTPSKALRLINDLIDSTNVQQDLIEWKRGNTSNGDGKVGKGYWYGFLKRHRDKLVSRRGQKYELNRQNWTTYSNFVSMYSHIIHEMLEAGVAEPLHEPIWMDSKGNICQEQTSFGCKVFHRLVRPDMCIVGDEVGGSISMKGDGHVGGQLYVCGRKEYPKKKIPTKSKKFTMIGLTALTGEPVMCILIIEGKLPNGSIEAGIDFTVTPTGSSSDSDFIIKNSGPGKHFPGGPECYFRNKTVPALVRWHESGSITSTILVEAL